MMDPHAQAALQHLRDPSQFHWSAVTLLLVVLYVYVEQARAGRWSVVLGGLAFWLMDWVNEIVNGLLFHFSGFAPAWSTAGSSAYTVLIGLNIEISLMFALMGVVALRTLPETAPGPLRQRLLIASLSALACVLVELVLHQLGALQWAWQDWNAHHPFLIWLLGYMPFFLLAYGVHDLPSRRLQLLVVGSLATLVIAALIVFIPVLHWI